MDFSLPVSGISHFFSENASFHVLAHYFLCSTFICVYCFLSRNSPKDMDLFF